MWFSSSQPQDQSHLLHKWASQAPPPATSFNPLTFDTFRTDLKAIITWNFKNKSFLGLFLSNAFLSFLFLLEPKHQRRAEIAFFFFRGFRFYREKTDRGQSGCISKHLLSTDMLSPGLTTFHSWYDYSHSQITKSKAQKAQSRGTTCPRS